MTLERRAPGVERCGGGSRVQNVGAYTLPHIFHGRDRFRNEFVHHDQCGAAGDSKRLTHGADLHFHDGGAELGRRANLLETFPRRYETLLDAQRFPRQDFFETFRSVDLGADPGGLGHHHLFGSIEPEIALDFFSYFVKRAEAGVAVLGICNGFQMLAEAGLVPGAMISNAGLKFICRDVELEAVNTTSKFTAGYAPDQVIALPIAHHDGNYACSADELKRLEDEDRIAFRYRANPNGSTAAIAGVLGPGGNVLGMMPHPERACDPSTGGTDGRPLFQSLIETLG